MKAITLYQPWASLVAVGAKEYETRSWATKYRGRIAIHAGMKDPLQDLYPVPFIRAVVQQFGKSYDATMRELPRGSVIATAELVGCWKIPNIGTRNPVIFKRDTLINGIVIIPINGDELLFGDWTPGRFAWELDDVKMLPEPIPARGKKGLWNWEE